MLSHIFTELSREYEERVYSLPQNPRKTKADQDSFKKQIAEIVNPLDSESADGESKVEKSPERVKPEWSDLEMVSLLRGVYHYGETKWVEIYNNYRFNGKTPHEISLKWKDVRYRMLKDLDRLNKKHQNPVKKLCWMIA